MPIASLIIFCVRVCNGGAAAACAHRAEKHALLVWELEICHLSPAPLPNYYHNTAITLRISNREFYNGKKCISVFDG